MNKKRNMPQMYLIFNYWKDKCITKDGDVEIEIGYEGYDANRVAWENSIPVVTDWGEPECFACGAWTGAAIEDADATDNDLKKFWNSRMVTSHLDRAHIVPRALGGSDNPNNLFCLCGKCHRESPDTIYPKEFFKWVYHRRKHPSMEECMRKAIKMCDEEGIYPLFTKNALSEKK